MTQNIHKDEEWKPAVMDARDGWERQGLNSSTMAQEFHCTQRLIGERDAGGLFNVLWGNIPTYNLFPARRSSRTNVRMFVTKQSKRSHQAKRAGKSRLWLRKTLKCEPHVQKFGCSVRDSGRNIEKGNLIISGVTAQSAQWLREWKELPKKSEYL